MIKTKKELAKILGIDDFVYNKRHKEVTMEMEKTDKKVIGKMFSECDDFSVLYDEIELHFGEIIVNLLL